MNQATFSDSIPPGSADRIIAEECDRLLESPLFVRSPVLSRLLQFLVDHRLRGGRSAPKAYAIATEALGRSADFDPAVDSYPRVMVGRLRALLDRYYAETTWSHRLRVPQGSYEIVVEHRETAPTGPQVDRSQGRGDSAEPGRSGARGPRRIGLLIAILLLLGLASIAAWRLFGGPEQWLSRDPVPVPMLEVNRPDAGNSNESRSIARALDSKLRDGLRRFDLVNLLSSRQAGRNAGMRAADFRLDTTIIQQRGGQVDVTLVLNRVADQRAIWSQQLRFDIDEVPEFAKVEPIMARIAGDYGVIVRDQILRQPDSFAPGFPCLAQFNRTRQMRDVPHQKNVENCLRATLKRNANDPVVLAALSLLRFGDWQPGRSSAARAAAVAEARLLAQKSYENGSNTSAGLFAVARANFYAGNCAVGNAMGNAAFRLNPYNPDIVGHLGLFKISCGQAEPGETLLRRALELDDSYPGIPAVTLAFLLSQRGSNDEAIVILDDIASPANIEPQYLMVRALVEARVGNIEQAHRLWKQLLAYTRQPANAPPEAVLRQFMIAPTVIARASQALRSAGVAPAAAGR